MAQVAPVGYITGVRREDAQRAILLPPLWLSMLASTVVFRSLPKVRCFHSPQEMVNK